MADPAPLGRRTFVPALAAGAGGGVLAAVSANNTWVTTDAGATHPMLSTSEAATSPLAGALAMSVLACWGVLMVTRGRFRRVLSWLGLLVAVAYVVAVVWGRWTVADAVRGDLERTLGAGAVSLTHTLWWWWALLAGVLVVLASGAAARFVGEWPEMGSRYDAPGERSDARDARPDNNLDMWKALDEGRDPTA